MQRRAAVVVVVAGALLAAGAVGAPPSSAASHARDAGDPAQVWLGVDLADAGRLPGDAEVRELAALGVRAVRVDVRWADLEPTRGQVAWGALDGLARSTEAAGIGWLARIHASPAWSRHDPAPPAHWWLCRDARPALAGPPDAAPPTDPADLATFAAALAARYADSLTAIEVWREPNLMPNWRAGGPDPEDYAQLLAIVGAAVHRAQPAVRVVSAAPAPTTELDPCVMDDVVFVGRLARSGALAAVDAVGIAPLGMRAGPDAAPDPDALGVRRAELHRRALDRAGVETPLWALSFGWATQRPGEADPIGRGAVPPQVAADSLRHAWERAARDWPWLGAVFVWGIQLPGDALPGHQPLTVDGQPSPLAASVADMAAGVGATDAREDGAAGSARGMGASRAWWPVGLALGLLAGAALAGRARPALAPWLRRRLAWPRAQPRMAIALGYLGAVLVLAASAGCPGADAGCPAVLPWPVGLGALGALAWLAAGAPVVAMAAVAAAAPFAHLGRLAIGPVPVATVELLVALAVGGWALSWYADLELPRRPRIGALDIVVLALVAWAALSPTWAPRPAAAWREWRTVLLEPALFYALLRTAPRPRDAARLALIGLAGGATAAAALGLVQVALGAAGIDAGVVAAEGVLRARGPYGSPNNLALLLGRATMLLGAAALAPGVAGRARSAARAALPIVATGLLATFSRGAVLFGLPAGTAVVGFWLAPRRRRLALVGLAGVIAFTALVMLPFAGAERIAGALRSAPGSTGYYRLQLWRSAGRMIADHPLLGVGLDGFLYAYREGYVARDVIQERFLSHPHNVLLDWWTRLGLPGVLLLAGLVVGHLGLARQLSRRPHARALVAGALGMQAYALAHGMVDNSFFLVDLAVATWLAQAALLAQREYQEEIDEARPSSVDPPLAVGPPGFEPGTYRL